MRIALYCIFLALLCQACNQTSVKGNAEALDPEAQARQLILAGDFPAAAAEYTRLTTIYPEQAVFYHLRTADTLIRSGDLGQADDLLEYTQALKSADIFYKNILLARLALKNNQAQKALRLLTNAPGEEISVELLIDWHRLKAEANELAINFAVAVDERLQLDKLLLDPAQRLTNIKITWNDLNRIETPVLNRQESSTNSETKQAWIELTLINKTMLFKPVLLEQSINSWIQRYPNHPAVNTITRDILALANKAVLQPKHIAMLLPLSGQYENAAHAIRNGFIAAWYGEQEKRPKITVYDASALNINSIYRQALADGADFIVGPLEKTAVDNLLLSDETRVTTLALNHAEKEQQESYRRDSQDLPDIIQFGLPPEDEARQIAERGIFDGHNKALVITPNNEWGFRLAEAFNESWSALGGRVLEFVSYDQRSKDYSTPVKKLLNIDSSQLRGNKLRQKLNRNLQTEPRLREDADMIFMASVPLSARQIVPQFRFYQANGIPVYTTSHAFSGVENAQADTDMNGVLITDIPAILDTKRKLSSIHTVINENWAADSSNYRRLYALGIDAYRLIPYIGKLALQNTAVYHGETGDLYIDENGRIQRKLMWARFVNGVPTRLD